MSNRIPTNISGSAVSGVQRLVLLAGITAIATSHAQSAAELDDAAARAQYAFYTADLRGLEEVQDVLERLSASAELAAMKQYHAGFVQWKIAQLHDELRNGKASAATNGSAIKAAQACEKHMRAATGHAPRLAEAFAIEALCGVLQLKLRGAGRSSATACSRSKALRTALELEPRNPRVRLIDYQCTAQTRNASEADGAKRFEQLRSLVEAFDAMPPSPAGTPDWGHAEALLLLGQFYVQRGDLTSARDALERALVIAPDYRAAQLLLQTASARPR